MVNHWNNNKYLVGGDWNRLEFWTIFPKSWDMLGWESNFSEGLFYQPDKKKAKGLRTWFKLSTFFAAWDTGIFWT